MNAINQKEEDLIKSGLRKHGRRAYDSALSKNVSVTVLRGNKVCQVNPDKSVTIIETRDKTKHKVTQKKYKLK